MWTALNALAWLGIGLVAWMLLSVACLSFMYFRGWLSPRRSEKIREFEDGMDGGSTATDRCGQEPAMTSVGGPRRIR